MSRRMRIFRWKAVGPLLLFLSVLVVLYVLFIDRIVRDQAESNLSEMLGTEVDIGSVRIRTADAAVDIGRLAIADPRDSMRNLFEAGTITLDLDPAPLAEKKIVIDRFKLSGLRFLTARKTPARPADPDSPAGRLLKETEQWARDKFQFPRLAMGRIDTVKSLVLKPGQLGTVQAAEALLGRVDSTRQAVDQGLASLELPQLLDSSTALVNRLARTDPQTLGLAGVKDAVTSVKQAIDRVKQTRARLATLEQSARGWLGQLDQGLADVNAAREKDYAMARGLLQLPSFAAPDIGASLFGQQSTDYFQQALYYARIAQRYVPPGLQPWNRPGPPRTRLAGTTVEFPRLKEYPRFLLRRGDIDLAVGSAAQNAFKAAVTGVTSQPALLGEPATLTASGRLGQDSPVSVDLSAFSRHFGPAPRDTLAATVTGVELPSIPFPGLPFAVNPGRSRVGFAFSLAGDRLAGRWEVSAAQASWSADTARLRTASVVESTVWKVISGLTALQVRAELGGTVEHPTLSVSSNLDDAIAARLRGLVGEELAKAEQKARAAVDQVVGQQLASLQARVTDLKGQALQRFPAAQGQLDGVQQQLDAQLKRLAGGAAGGLKLPKF